MNKQDVIEILNELNKNYFSDDFDEANEAIEQAIAELRSQIPKKPEYDCHKHLYICPHCGEYIVTYNHEFPYDMKCGGRLEW